MLVRVVERRNGGKEGLFISSLKVSGQEQGTECSSRCPYQNLGQVPAMEQIPGNIPKCLAQSRSQVEALELKGIFPSGRVPMVARERQRWKQLSRVGVAGFKDTCAGCQRAI